MLRVVLASVGSLVLMAAALLASAGRVDWPMAWAFLLVNLGFTGAALVWLSPDLLRERSTIPPDVRLWDLVLSSLFFVLLYPVTFVVCGLDVRFGWSPALPRVIEGLGLVVFAAGYGFAFWALHTNAFFSTFVRIQRERGHHVVDSGPYAIVRHPGYAGAMAAHLALPLALGSLWGLLPAAAGCVFLVLRTASEDRVLADELAGYRDYRLRVPFRLVPGLW